MSMLNLWARTLGRSARVSVVVAVAALALGAVACGGSGDDGGSSGSGGQAQGGDGAGTGGTGKTVDAKAVCDLMTEKAQKETADYVRVKDATCEQAFNLLLQRSKNAGTLDETVRARVIGVNVEGDRATATVQFGPRGAATAVPLVKEDGEWKLGGSLTGGRPAPKGKDGGAGKGSGD
jgi:hypothetical protein